MIAKNRDEIHFKKYFLANFKAYTSYAASIIQDNSFSQDIVSEIMWKLWHLGPDLITISSVESYVLRSIKNKCLNILRVKKFEYVDINAFTEVSSYDDNPEVRMITSEEIRRIEQAIDVLPLKTREAFRLVKEERKTYLEAATIMGISKKTVDRHIQNALSTLWATIKEKK